MIVAIVTVSKELTASQNATPQHDALHPCRDCRDFMRALIKRGVMKDETVVYNVNDKELPEADIKMIGEERTIKDLLALYQDEQAAA